MTSWVDLAQLVGSADDIGAQVNALPGAVNTGLTSKSTFTVAVRFTFILLLCSRPFRLASHLQVTWVAKVSIGAYTRGTMILSHAEGIGTTLNLGARVHALAQTLAQLETDLRVETILVIATLTTNAASLDLVLGISNVTHWADTFSGIADGPWAA